jgi:hypothetical protein
MASGNADVHVSADPACDHILSDKSRELQRDTFFFAPMGGHPIQLVLGQCELKRCWGSI